MKQLQIVPGILSHSLPDWVLPIAVIVLLPSIYFARALLPGQTIFSGDMDMAYSMQGLIKNQPFELPFWHPYVSSGLPLFPWAPLFYPPHLLASWLLPIEQIFAWSYILHFSLAGIGMYLFLRYLTVRSQSALIGALVFMFNGYTVLRVFAGHFMYIYAVAWIPLIFYFAEKSLRERRALFIVACGLALGLQALVALTQIWVYTLLILGVYCLVRAADLIFLEKSLQASRILKHLVIILPIFVIAIGIGAVYWIPTLENLSVSVRSEGLDWSTATAGSLPPTHLATLIFPNLFGTEIDQNYWGYFMGYVSQVESNMYVGVLTIVLAIVGLRNFRVSKIMALLAVALGALLLALGRFTPIYQLAYYSVPGLNSFRIPSRAIVLFCFAVSSLAGIGLGTLETRIGEERWIRRWAWLFVGLGMITALVGALTQLAQTNFIAIGDALAYSVYASTSTHTRPVSYTLEIVRQAVINSPKQFVPPALVLLLAGSALLLARRLRERAVWILGGLIVLDVLGFGWRYVITRSSTELINADQRELLAYIKESPAMGRIYTESNLIPTNMGNVLGYANVEGDFPQIVGRYRDLTNYASDKSQGAVEDRRLFQEFEPLVLRMLNVTTAFTLQPIHSPGWQTVAQEPVQILAYDRVASDYPILQQATAYVSKSTNSLPRAFMAYDAQIISDASSALATIYASDFDPARTVVLDQPISAMGVASTPATVNIQRYTPNALSIAVKTGAAGILVLSEIYAPGWSATIDGQPTPVLCADYTLRGVYVSAGQHTIEMNYLPPGLDVGLAISLGTCASSFVGLWLSGRIARRQSIPTGGATA